MDISTLINILSDIRDQEGNIECEVSHDSDDADLGVSLIKLGKTPVVVIS